MYKKEKAMALIICPECGHEVSDTAESCPKCGYSIYKNIQIQKVQNRKTEIQQEKNCYYNQKFKEIFDSISLPSEPSNQEIKDIKFAIIISSILFFITLLISVICFFFSSIEDWLIFIDLVILGIVIYLRVFKLPKVKYEYECLLDNYYNIIKNPETYKKEITEKILKNDTKLIEYELMQDSLERKKSTKDVLKYTPHCPTCGSPNIEKISISQKITGDFFWGFKSQNVRNQFHCKNCGYKW